MGVRHTRLLPATIGRSATKKNEDLFPRPPMELHDRSSEIQVLLDEQNPTLPDDVNLDQQEGTIANKIYSNEDPNTPSCDPEESERAADVDLPKLNVGHKYDGEDTMPIIWLDVDVHDSNENIDLQRKLKAVTKSLTVFNDDELCEEHIRQLTVGDQVIFIVAGSIGVTFIPLVHDSTQLSVIYVYSLEQEYYKNKFKQYSKVEVIIDANKLIEKIRDRQIHQQNFVEEQLSLNIYTQKGKLLNESQWEGNDRFMWIYMFMKIFFRMSHLPELTAPLDERQHLVEKLHELYNDADNQSIIDKFNREYSSNIAVYWYTYPGPVYKTLNKALRERNLELLFLFRFFIFDLCKQLKSQWRNHALNRVTWNENPRPEVLSTESLCSFLEDCQINTRVLREMEIDRPGASDNVFRERSTICVYRVQNMSSNEIELLRNSIGELVSVNSFLSTSLREEVADRFASSNSSEPSDSHFVLFTIYIFLGDVAERGAYIGHISHFKGEDEVLLAPGTIFRIQYVSPTSPWNIRLILCNKNSEELERIAASWETIIALEKNQTLPEWLIMRPGQLDQAEKYYKLLLEYLPDEDSLRKYCYNALGNLYQKEHLFSLAVECHTKALKTAQEADNDPIWRAKCCSSLANAYLSMDQTEEAHKLYQEALSIYENNESKRHREMAECYSNIGRIYQEKKNYVQAEMSFDVARGLYQINLTRHPPTVTPPLRNLTAPLRSLITSLKNLAVILRLRCKFFEASKRQYEAIKICKQYLRADDPEVGHLYKEIGDTYRVARRFELALTFYHKAAEIYYYTYPERNQYNVMIRRHIKDTNKKLTCKESMEPPHYCYEPPDID